MDAFATLQENSILDMARTGNLEVQQYCLDTSLIIRKSCRKLKKNER
jgi:hypothetical protein